MIYPVVLGAGERLFGETSDKIPMRLVGTRTVDDPALLSLINVGPRREHDRNDRQLGHRESGRLGANGQGRIMLRLALA